MNVLLLIRNLFLFTSSVNNQCLVILLHFWFFYSGIQSVDQSMNLFLICNVSIEVIPTSTAAGFFLDSAIGINDHFFISSIELRQYRYPKE